MIVGPLKAPPEYSLSQGPDDPRMPEIISGDLKRFNVLRRRLKSTRIRHFTISYAPEDRPTKAGMIEDAEALLNHFAARFPQPFQLDRLETLIVLHREAAGDQIGPPLEARKRAHRFALHVHLIEYDLLTGRRLQPYYAPAHRQALGAWLRAYNRSRGYACPTDPARSRRNAPQPSQRELNEFAGKLANATLAGVPDLAALTPATWANLLRPHCRAGTIGCRPRGAQLVADVRLPRMKSRTRLRTLSNRGLEVRAAKAARSRNTACVDDEPPRAFATYLRPTAQRKISGKPSPLFENDAADALAPTRPGADPSIAIVQRKAPATPTIT